MLLLEALRDGGVFMLDQAILKELKQTNIGKDGGKIKERLRDIWMNIEKSQREEIMNFSDLTKYTVERSYKNGNISAKLALAVAHVLKINPNYLTGESDERGEYSDEVARQFLIDAGYGKLLDRSAKPKRTYNRKNPVVPVAADASGENTAEQTPPSDDTTAVTEGTTAVTEDNTEPKKPEVSPAEPPTSPYDSLLSRIQDKVRVITQSEQEKLDSMPADTAEQLLKGLYLRTEYSEEAKRLAALLKIILTL